MAQQIVFCRALSPVQISSWMQERWTHRRSDQAQEAVCSQALLAPARETIRLYSSCSRLSRLTEQSARAASQAACCLLCGWATATICPRYGGYLLRAQRKF